MAKNLERRVKDFFMKSLATSIIGLASLGLANKAKADYDFVNPQGSSVLVSASSSPRPHVMGDPQDLIPFKNWTLIPRTPAISNDWIAYVQNPNPDYATSAPEMDGDVYVIYRGPQVSHQGKKIRITNTQSVGIVDLDENNLVYNMGEGISAPHWPSEIYLTDLSKINLDYLTDLGDGTFAPSENENYYETCITCGMSTGDSGNMDPQVSGDKIVWRTGHYKPHDNQNNNFHKKIVMYNINEEMAFPISNSRGNYGVPSIDGDWVVYPTGNGSELYYTPKIYAYNISTGKEILVDSSGGLNDTVRVYHDPTESGQAIVVYGKGHGIPCSSGGVGISRLELNGESIIINPSENHYNLPAFIPSEGMVDWIDIFGRKGTISNPGKGPVITFMDYGPTGYGGGTKISGHNLRSGTSFPVASAGANWLYSPRGWINNNGQAIITYRNDNAQIPPVGTFGVMSSNENLGESLPTLFVNDLKERPIPAYCGDEGTWYYQGDFNKDCSVNLEDLVFFGNEWLNSNCSYKDNACNGTDLNQDTFVDFKDYLVWEENLGKRSFGLPEFNPIDSPLAQPNINAMSDVNFYHNENKNRQSMQEGYVEPLTQERTISYVLQNNSFGNLGIDKIEIPVENVESTNPYLEYSLYDFDSPRSRFVGKGWNVSNENNITYSTTNPEQKLNAGKTAVFNILTSAPGYQIKPVRVYATDGRVFEYNMKVPLEQTLRSDFNRDGEVNSYDLGILASNFLGKGRGDTNGDINVDLQDFANLATEFDKREGWYGEGYTPFN